MRKFISWVGAIASPVIVALLIYYFTPSKSTSFEGMVIDGAQSAPIKGAMVTFEVEPAVEGSGQYHDFTDENGSYKMDVSHLPGSVKVKLRAQAKGFHDSTPVAVASLQDDNRNDFLLSPVPTPEPPPVHAGVTPSPSPAVTINPGIKLRYIPKAAFQKFDFKAAGH